ncbi:MAG: Maf family protein [Lachnospiraceae bacterium]|nr:Maf family protein [Lachnospiraceae bacterium]
MIMRNDTEYILASGSPRRKELLARAGLEYRVLVSDAKEDYPEGMKPEEIVKLLAGRKGHAVAELLMEDAAGETGDIADKKTDRCTEVYSDVKKHIYVISADTIVVLGDRILGKPADRKESEEMIRALQGRDHQVWTGVQVICMSAAAKSIEREICFADCTTVHVVPMDDESVKAYVDSGEGDDKAGAYAIQGGFAEYISGYDGDFDNVVGLPVSHLMEVLGSPGQ